MTQRVIARSLAQFLGVQGVGVMIRHVALDNSVTRRSLEFKLARSAEEDR